MNGAMLYGGPPLPSSPWEPREPLQPISPSSPQPGEPGYDRIRSILNGLATGTRVRVSVLVEDDGQVRLKLEEVMSGKLIAEVSGSRTLVLEAEVGGP